MKHIYVHYTEKGMSHDSPCGDEDMQAPVTSEPSQVSCPDCKKWLKIQSGPMKRKIMVRGRKK